MVYLYEEAFGHYRMGYATALAWVLFVIILGLTFIVNRMVIVYQITVLARLNQIPPVVVFLMPFPPFT